MSDYFDEQIVAIKFDKKFYMTSYLMYLLVARTTDYLGLDKKGRMHDPNAWPYVVYLQLAKKKIPLQSVEYRVVSNKFIYSIIRFIEGDYAKRNLVEAVAKNTKISAYYIQFKKFTYLRVEGTLLCPKKVPRYPSDRLIVLEIAHQLTSSYDKVRRHGSSPSQLVLLR